MKAVIFDIDGTLLDSVDLHAEAWRRALAHFGHAVAFHEVRSQIGKGGDQLLPVFLTPAQIAIQGRKLEKYRGEIFRRDYLPAVRPFPKVRELFARLRADAWKVSLASSAKQEELVIYKALARISDLLDTETSSSDAKQSKPHPDIFEAARARLGGVPASDCIVIGDSPFDAEAARAAGMPAVGMLCGGFPPQALLAAGCGSLQQDPASLLGQLEETGSLVAASVAGGQ